MRHLVFAFITASIAALTACGANVAVDGPVGSGTGGATTTSTQTGTGATTTTPPGAGGGAACGFPNVATLTPCGGSGSSGGMCIFDYCGGGDTYEASCSSTGCSCMKNGAEVCSCSIVGPGDICSGTPDCCFHP